MKKILFACNIVNNDNSYVERLFEITQTIHNVEVYSSLDEFWNPTRKYDFVIINWPDYLFNWRKDLNQKDIQELEHIFSCFKLKGTIIITVLHDEYAHWLRSYFRDKIFDICYQKCDVLIHLGNYSYKKYTSDKKYSNQYHAIIYHPLFKKFSFNNNKLEARKRINIKENDFYIIVPGGIRHQYEYEYVMNLYKKISIKNKKIQFLRSSYIDKPKKSWTIKFLLFKLQEKLTYKIKGIKHHYKFMPHSTLSDHFSACDLVILPRVDILNSGNVTLGTQFKKVIIGLGIGNIKEWLVRFNHIVVDSKKRDLLKKEELTDLILKKKNSISDFEEINTICSDEAIKEQISAILDHYK